MKSILPKIVFLLMVAFAAVHFSAAYAQLPAVVASHFNANGAANGWQTKQGFFDILIVVTGVSAVLVFAIPALTSILPIQFVNLPNKQYWLAPERAAETRTFMSSWFGWFGCAVYGLICFAFDYAVKWNLSSGQNVNPDEMWYALGAFLVLTIVLSIGFFLRFSNTSDS